MVSARCAEVRILSEAGMPVEEYAVKKEDMKTTTCFIASEEAKVRKYGYDSSFACFNGFLVAF